MKLAVILFMVAFLSIGATAAFGTDLTISNATTLGSSTITFSPSSNVRVYAKTDAQSYAAESKHLNGDRCIGGASDASRLYYKSCGAGNFTDAGVPSNTGSAEFATGWSSM